MEQLGALTFATYEAGAAVVAGLIGGIAFLGVVYGGRTIGMTRMDFLRVLGSMMAPKATRRATIAIGFPIHMMLSAAFGLVYAGVVSAIGVTSVGSAAGWDALIGAAHGVLVLIAMPLMLVMAHPLVRAGEIEEPRKLMTGFGSMTPIGSLAAHVVFGLVTGSIYAAAVL